MRLSALLTVSVALVAACRTGGKVDNGDGDVDTGALASIDADGDGFSAAEDCDDDDASVNSGAVEICDGIDNDCDGEIDEEVTGTWYEDADQDGYGDPNAEVEGCSQPAGAVDNDADCDDTDSTVSPVASERCNGVDDDCDGSIDEDVQDTWYADRDGDGYGDLSGAVDDCDPDDGYVSNADDCDDEEATVNPDAEEVCDDVDNNCDGVVDDDAVDTQTWYLDADGDGFGDADTAFEGCDPPTGYVAVADDCDDTNIDINPDAAEVCDFVDNDCDGLVDDADADVDLTGAGTWYADLDGDGFGDDSTATTACVSPAGSIADGGDCDDTEVAVNPGATEVCNGIDDDCDGALDDADSSLDASTTGTWYADTDGDGFGDASASTEACTQPSGTVADATDCDDGNGAINPGESELCNGVDDDCDGLADDADSSVDTTTQSTWYADADGDGYGSATSSTDACSQPAGTVSNATDCDDAATAVNPGASEVCNGVDDDCDGATDDADASLDTSTQSTWYADSDNDGFGDAGTSTDACTQPSGTVANDLDCDDADSAVNPSAQDVCNGDDDNCDGDIDEEALDGMVLISVDTNAGQVYEIDPATAAATSLGAFSYSAGGINTVAVDGTDAYGYDFTNGALVDLDVCNTSGTALPGHGTGANTCGVVFGPGGLLYGLDTTNDRLVEYDPATGQITPIGSLGITIGSCGMAYDCTNDVLIGADGSGNRLFKINATTGAAYDIVSVGFTFASVGIEFDPTTQSVLASNRSALFDVDLNTGAHTRIGAYTGGSSNIDDLIYYPECP